MRVRRIVDLSVPLNDATPVYPGDPLPRLTAHATIGHDGFNLLAMSLGSQTGTHVDSPFHVDANGAGVDALDLRLCAGPGVLVDAAAWAGPGGLSPRQRIGWEPFDAVRDRLGPGVIVLLRTGWDAHAGTPAAFAHPFLDAGACARLLATGVRTILLDSLSPDETPDDDHPDDGPGEGLPVHRLVAAAGGVIGENLCGLERVTWPDPFVCALPLRISAGDGSPVRAVAMDLG